MQAEQIAAWPQLSMGYPAVQQETDMRTSSHVTAYTRGQQQKCILTCSMDKHQRADKDQALMPFSETAQSHPPL